MQQKIDSTNELHAEDRYMQRAFFHLLMKLETVICRMASKPTFEGLESQDEVLVWVQHHTAANRIQIPRSVKSLRDYLHTPVSSARF